MLQCMGVVHAPMHAAAAWWEGCRSWKRSAARAKQLQQSEAERDEQTLRMHCETQAVLLRAELEACELKASVHSGAPSPARPGAAPHASAVDTVPG